MDVTLESKLAGYSDVKGGMVIRPNGYALWENMQHALDGMFKATGWRAARRRPGARVWSKAY